jgi:hypothetical protein
MSGKLALNQEYWDLRYQENNIPWDIGYASPAIVGYLKGLDLQGKSVLIPGAGNAYEAFWLAQNSDALITVVDISPTVISELKIKMDAMNLNINLVVGDFFDHTGKYDIIVEQTFFCAIYPELRENYVQKMVSLMHKDSVLFGLLFNIQFDKPGPPFGGFKDEYMQLFSKYFDDVRITHTENSVPPRKGNEVFMEVKRPKNM